MKVQLLIISFCVSFVSCNEVCYPPFGCFNDDYPFDEALLQLPWSPKDIDTKFLYYTRNDLDNPSGYINITDPKSPSKVGFDSNKPTIILTHGYVESSKRWWVDLVIKELLNKDDMNLIFVEWTKGAIFPYHQSAGNTRLVGAQISYLIEMLRNGTGIDWPRLRLIGFSLGAHVMGFAGRNLRRKGMTLPHISGLDPLAPYFEDEHVDRRLDPTDADFVDVIHTGARTIYFNGFGSTQNMGHIDFWPNGGSSQLGCEKFDLSVLQYFARSHYRSMRYFIESINSPCPYYGYPCKSYEYFKNGLCSHCPDEGCPRMGYHVTKPKKKLENMDYYLQTNTVYPFCVHHYSIGFHTGSGFLKDLDGKVTIILTGSKMTKTITLKEKHYNSGSSEQTMFKLTDDIGTPQKVKVKHNRIIDIWYLEAVDVRLMSTNDTYVACFNGWVNGHEADLLIGSVSDCQGK